MAITPGGRAVLRIVLARPDSRSITFNLTGLPVGAGAALQTRSSRERRIILEVPATTRPGTYLVRISTANPGRVRTAAVTLVVTGDGVLQPGLPIAPVPTVAPAPTPPAVPPSVAPVPTVPPLVVPQTSSETIVMQIASGGVVVAGGSAPIGEVEAVVLNGTGPAVLVAQGLPAGLVVTFPGNVAGAANGRTPIVAAAAPGIAAGSYPFTVIARTERVTTSIGAVVRVVDAAPSALRYPVTPVAAAPGEQQGFGIAANSAAPTVARGQSAQVLVTITPRGGFTRPVELSLAGFPSGVTARLAPTNLANVVALGITVPPGSPWAATRSRSSGRRRVCAPPSR